MTLFDIAFVIAAIVGLIWFDHSDHQRQLVARVQKRYRGDDR